MSSACLKLPFPPSANKYWRSRIVVPRSGKAFVNTYVSEDAKRYRRNVAAAVVEWLGRVPTPTVEPVKLDVLVYQPDRRKRDADNLLKCLLDSLTHAAVWLDDSQARDIHIRLGPVEPPGWLEVTVERIHDPQGKLFA